MTPNAKQTHVIVDYDYAGDSLLCTHRFPIDDSELLTDPLNPGQTITPLQLLARLNGNAKLRESSGWHVVNQHAGETKPTTRWQRLIAHTNSKDGHPALKALNLIDGDKNDENILS